MPFYERVKKAALEFGISQKELIPRAVDDFIQEQRKEKRELTSGKCEGGIAIEWSPEQAWETPTSAAGA